ncbi:MAG: hypothetical protein NVV62_10170 [Terricaulis sp.]|nr:hypothetical protein [Terricaulis sp.]
MKATHNPYNPGAGVPPPELTGRDALIEQARVAIVRVKAGRSRQKRDPAGPARGGQNRFAQ